MYVPSVERERAELSSRVARTSGLSRLLSLSISLSLSFSSSRWPCGGFAGVHPHGPAEKRGSADQRERTASGSPVDKLPPADQVEGTPRFFQIYLLLNKFHIGWLSPSNSIELYGGELVQVYTHTYNIVISETDR